MKLENRVKKFGIIFMAIIVVTSLLLMYKANDPIAIGLEKKEGILTAEQVKVAFDSVGGRMVSENVQEAQHVKKGDVLMVLDSTDMDIAIAQLEAQIASLDAQINGTSGTMNVQFAAADTNEQHSFRQIDAQKAGVEAARSSLNLAQLDYDRKAELKSSGAISQAEMDAAVNALNVANSNYVSAQQQLANLLGGAADSGNTDGIALPDIANARMSAGNMKNTIDGLIAQKKGLEEQLKQLKVNKERLTLRAPEDGKIIKIIAKQGEMVAPNVPVILMESDRCYYDIYVNEEQMVSLHEGDSITGTTVAGEKSVAGTIRLITQAPGFADVKMTREKGQADLSSFQIRIFTEPTEGVIPGMTVGVKL